MTATRKCSGPTCGADVIFVPSAKSGKPMILDAKPKKGVVLVVPQSSIDGSVILAADYDHPEDAVARVVDVYADHHAACPDVMQFTRKPKEAHDG